MARNEFFERVIKQKKEMIDKFPNSQIFVNNSKVGLELFDRIKIIDMADKEIRDEWGFKINDEQIKEWNDKVRELVKMADEIEKLGVSLLAETKRIREIIPVALKNKVREYKEKNNIKV